MPNINLTGVEATANKSTNVNTDQASNTKYPSVKAVFDWAVGLFVKKGTLTTNYVQKATATDTIGDSQIFDNGTNVGINQATPTSRLHIKGTIDTAAEVLFKVDSATNNDIIRTTSQGTFSINQTNIDSTFNLKGNAAGNDIMNVQKSNDNIVFLIQAGGTIKYYDVGVVHSNITNAKTALGLGATEAEARLHVRGTSTGDDVYSFIVENSTGTDFFRVDDAGDVEATNRLILTAETASRATYLDANKAIRSSSTTDTELGYVSGVTSSIQTQLNAKMSEYFFSCLVIASPADSTSYFFSQVPASPLTTAAGRQFNFKKDSTLKEVLLNVSQSVNGSNQLVTLYLYNVTTATRYLVGTWDSSFGATRGKGFSFLALNIPIVAAEDYAWEMLTPAWTTNPTNQFYMVTASILE